MSVRPAHPAAVFAGAALGAAALNALLALALVAVTGQGRGPDAEAPLAVFALRTVEQPSPQEAPAPPPAAEASERAAAQAPILPALPRLDLPAAPTPGALALPELPALADGLDLPLAVPPIRVAGAAGGAGTGLDVPSAAPIGEPDQPARLLGAIDLDRFYPRAARGRGIEGESVIRIEVGADGGVTGSSIERSDPPGVFDDAARRLAGELRFEPARRGGVAVPARVVQRVLWRLRR